MNRTLKARFALNLLTAATLAACGGGNDDAAALNPNDDSSHATFTLEGQLSDARIEGATVCLDVNDNRVCDAADTASTTTDAQGRYRLSVTLAGAGGSASHLLIADVPATATDSGSGQPVGQALTLKAPIILSAAPRTVLNALTTAVTDLMHERDLPVAKAAARVQAALGLTASPLADPMASGAEPQLARSSHALAAVSREVARLAGAAALPAAEAAALRRAATTGQLALIGVTLGANAERTPAEQATEVVQAVKAGLNLDETTTAAVGQALGRTGNVSGGARGPTASLRRFAYRDANNHSATWYIGDASVLDAQGHYAAHEVRVAMVDGAVQPYNRNQAYWNGSDWQTCATQWQVITQVTLADEQGRNTSLYCGGSRSESRTVSEDISGQTLRAVVARLRAYPLPDNPGAHTDARGLPVNWGPDPTLLPAEAVFPPGSVASVHATLGNVGGSERIELANKSSVRWPDGRYRQATTLEQYGGMPGDLADAATQPANANTVYVADLPLASASDATLEAFKRYRAGFDVAALKIRFYACDVRKVDQAALNCVVAGDGRLAIAEQGDARLLRVASGYPTVLLQRLGWQRFWAQRHGTVFRGARDLERLQHSQRLNETAAKALVSALGITLPSAPAGPVQAGPFLMLRSFTFRDVANHSWRVFSGDTRVLDADGRYALSERRETRSAGQLQPFVRNRTYWTGSAWTDCPNEGPGVATGSTLPPYTSVYCGAFIDTRAGRSTVTLEGRVMADVIRDIRAYGSKDGSFDYGGWGPDPAQHAALASARFPQGATMTYNGSIATSTPLGIATGPGDRLRVAPPQSGTPFESWPLARSLDEVIAAYPGDLGGGPLNGATAVYAYGYDLPTPPSAQYTTRVEIRVAFDAAGQRARFYANNRRSDNNATANYQLLLDTGYTLQTLGDVRLLRFAALPEGMEQRFGYQRLFAERAGNVWYAFHNTLSAEPQWSIRLNGEATLALLEALGI
ncbi:MAG: hypothetical protein IT500_15280 [Rubrivivax sp.]|nr:hypothetical protein [Rubrivivax sp.]